MDREARGIARVGDYGLFVGWRSDPFFFDPVGTLNNLQFTGTDFFAEKDVCSIVLEVPNSALGCKEVGLWVRTLDGADGLWVQADRGARPAQSIFLPGDERSPYPGRGAGGVTQSLSQPLRTRWHAGECTARRPGGSQARYCRTSYRFDPTQPASYPGSGRSLTDDVLDHFLSIFTNGRATRRTAWVPAPISSPSSRTWGQPRETSG